MPFFLWILLRFFCCPFLRQCVWLAVLLVSWCHFPWLQRKIQHPGWEVQNQYLHLNIWLPVTGERSALVQGQWCQHNFEVPRLMSFQSVTSQGLLGVGNSTEPKHWSWFLVPSGIACIETRSLIAEPQASFFNCSELIPSTRSLCAVGNVGNMMPVFPVGVPQHWKLCPRYVFRRQLQCLAHPWSFVDKEQLFAAVTWGMCSSTWWLVVCCWLMWENWMRGCCCWGRCSEWKRSQISRALEFQERREEKQWTNELKPEDFNTLKELVNAVLWKGILMGKGALENSQLLKEALKMGWKTVLMQEAPSRNGERPVWPPRKMAWQSNRCYKRWHAGRQYKKCFWYCPIKHSDG